jgi:hypothetical protein
LPGAPTSLDDLHRLTGVFYLVISELDNSGVSFRRKKIYQPADIRRGRFVSVNAEDIPVDLWSSNWDDKPVADWARFDLFDSE